jgi:hypothetical protein
MQLMDDEYQDQKVRIEKLIDRIEKLEKNK